MGDICNICELPEELCMCEQIARDQVIKVRDEEVHTTKELSLELKHLGKQVEELKKQLLGAKS